MGFRRRLVPWPLPSGSKYGRVQHSAFTYQTGYQLLGNSITANSTTVSSPMFRFHGSSAAATWVPEVGATSVVETGTGSSPTYAQTGAWGNGVKYATSQKYHANTSNPYPVALEDFVIECVFKYVNVNGGVVANYATTGGIGYILQPLLSGVIRLYLRKGGTSVALASASSTLTVGSTYHIMAFVDRSDAATSGARIYVNGSLVASGSASTLSAATLSDATCQFNLGRSPDGPLYHNDNLYYAAGWKQASWFAGGATNSSEWAAIAAARYASVGVAL